MRRTLEDRICAALTALLILLSLVWCGWLIVDAHNCAAAGGAYIIPQQGFPVCVAGVPR